jgi:hypothetical protein
MKLYEGIKYAFSYPYPPKCVLGSEVNRSIGESRGDLRNSLFSWTKMS